MAPTYKLTYFDQRGLGEPIRLVFAYARIPYEDVQIESKSWAQTDKTSKKYIITFCEKIHSQ